MSQLYQLTFPYELITVQRYPNIRKTGEVQTKQLQYEILSSMLRLAVELLHFVREKDLSQVEELHRTCLNIEKLFDFMPYEEVDTLKLVQTYLDEFKQFIRDGSTLDSKEQVKIDYLQRQVHDLNHDKALLVEEKLELRAMIEDFDKRIDIFRVKHVEEVESVKRSYMLQVNELNNRIEYLKKAQTRE